MTQKRQPKGIPVGGEFAENLHDEAPSSLASSAPGATFEEVRDAVTERDLSEAYKTVSTKISNDSFPNGEHSWKNVMGAKTPMTEANEARYAAHLRSVIDSDPAYSREVGRQARISASYAAYGRAFEQGVDIDGDAEAYFESVWNDPEHSFGESSTRKKLQGNTSNLAALESGAVKPSAIVGSGYKNPKKVAKQYLEQERETLENALRTRGRSQSVLVSNANYRLRQRDAGE